MGRASGEIVIDVPGTTQVPVVLPPLPGLPESVNIPVNLAEFRAQYPQYDSDPDDDLSHGLWRKFYSDRLPNGDFLDRCCWI